MSRRTLPALLSVLLGALLLVGCASAPTPAALPSSSPAPALTLTPTLVPGPTPVPATATLPPTPTATDRPTATPTPTPLPGAALRSSASAVVAFETYRDGNGEIYVLDTATGELTNLTRHPADDRSPAWRPDGGAIAFESHRDGNWDIYVLDLTGGELSRLTDHLAYDGAPAWSPDGSRVAFESYRDGNLNLFVVAATGGQPRPLTADPAGDYGPAWSPDGETIAFTSWRDGNKEVYAVPAAGGDAVNLTVNPADDEDPAWAPDGSALAFTSWRNVDAASGNRNAEIYRLSLAGGSAERLTDNPWPDEDPAWDAAGRLVWSAYDPGPAFETYDPYRPGDWHLYRAAAEGPQRLTGTAWDDRRPAPAPGRAVDLRRLSALLPSLPPAPTPRATLAPGALAQVVEVPTILAGKDGPPIVVNELVTPSLVAWQQDLRAAGGWDFLHVTLGSWRNVDDVRRKQIYKYDTRFLSWHKTGRALDLALEWKSGGVDHLVKVREDLGQNVYWRLYLRTAAQDGSQGEPLKDNPWQFWWHIVPEEDPAAYEAGGRRLAVPDGYYVDVTALAKRYGWERIASYAIPGDYDWRTDSNGTEYWHYERADGLLWWEAMRQIYDAETLDRSVGWQAGLGHTQTEAMMRSKGVPTPTP